jgi:hypothetical protein
VWESRGERVVNVYKCRQRGGAEEIGTLRFGWLEKVAGRGWELPKVTRHAMRLMNLKLFDSNFLANNERCGLKMNASDCECVNSCCAVT